MSDVEMFAEDLMNRVWFRVGIMRPHIFYKPSAVYGSYFAICPILLDVYKREILLSCGIYAATRWMESHGVASILAEQIPLILRNIDEYPPMDDEKEIALADELLGLRIAKIDK